MDYMLFPHTQISGSDLNQVIERFGNLTICQPWFMENAVTDLKESAMTDVHIQNPSTVLKPREDFRTLLSEYRDWVIQNRDNGYANLLATTEEGELTENTPWEIRQLISKGRDNSDPQKDKSFKWHLILHLAREFEESRVEAENLLKRLKDQKSPLEGALEEDPPQSYFEDTPLMETELMVDAYRLKQVFEAWFGLFGEYISEDIQLITLNPLVISYASEIFEPEEKTIRPKTHKTKKPPGTSIRLPKLSEREKEIKDPVIRGLTGKTLILLEK